MSKSIDERFEAINKLLDDLLGPAEKWPDRDVDQFLADAGVDMDAASRRLFEQVSRIAGTYRERNQDIPEPVAELLRQMRPIDLATSDPEVAKSAARSWIAKLRRPAPQFGAPQIAYAFRNRKESLAAKDQAVLEALEKKLRARKGGD